MVLSNRALSTRALQESFKNLTETQQELCRNPRITLATFVLLVQRCCYYCNIVFVATFFVVEFLSLRQRYYLYKTGTMYTGYDLFVHATITINQWYYLLRHISSTIRAFCSYLQECVCVCVCVMKVFSADQAFELLMSQYLGSIAYAILKAFMRLSNCFASTLLQAPLGTSLFVVALVSLSLDFYLALP